MFVLIWSLLVVAAAAPLLLSICLVFFMNFDIKHVLLMQRGNQSSHKTGIPAREVWKTHLHFSPLSSGNAILMWNLISTLHEKHSLPPKTDPKNHSKGPKAALHCFWAVSWRFFALHLRNMRPREFAYFIGKIGKMRLEPLSQITCALLKPLVHGLYAG